jgi:magnesium chelatase family protein
VIASVHSASVLGARGHRVGVEVHVGPGLPSLTMLGLPDESCREARDRVRAAVLSSGLSWPDRRVTVNLAPPTHRKSGSGLDLAIAVGVLAATEQIDAEALGGRGFAGELGLDGSLRAVAGVAPMVGVAPELEWVVPSASVGEASAVAVTEVRGVSSLTELVDVLAGVAPVAAAVAELLREGWLADEAGWLEVAVSGLPP